MAIRTTRTGQNALLSHLRALLNLQRFNHNLAEAGSQAQLDANVGSDSVSRQGRIEFSKWRKMDSRTLGITRSMISLPSWIVMKVLQSKGFEVYLVGGCVRDLLLNRIPKDFDLITTAALKQIRKQFHHSEIVGQRFPICRVHVKGSVIEVSSFETVAQHAEKKEKFLLSQMPKGCDKKDFTRWRNCMHRDFTINSLFFDPFVNKIYDYANGMMDIRSLKLRTLIPAELSFKEDCARILRCLRLAARLNLSFSKETEAAIRKLSPSINKLNKSRMIMELNYMLSYGAAESSLCLLRRFNMLDILLPVHAAYLDQQTSKQSSQSSIMLMKLFFQLDKLVTCDRPSDCILWVGLLAFHLGLLNKPQQALVVLTFASVLYHGNWKEGVKFARQNAQVPLSFVPEISEACEFISDDELAKRVTQLASLVQDSIDILTDEDSLLETMARFPGLPCSGVVIVSKKMGNNVAELFHVLVHDVESFKKERHSLKINYSLLGKGNLCETRFVIGKIIMDTMGCGGVQRGEVNQEEKDDLHSVDPEQKADVFEENSHRAPDLKKPPSLGKDDRGCSKPPSNCELKQDSSKKQNLTGKKSKFSEERMPKNPEAIANKEPEEKAEKRKDLININKCLELAKKHQNSITKCHLGQEDRIEQREGVLENKECHLDQHGVVTKKNNNSVKEEINTVGSRLRLSSLFK